MSQQDDINATAAAEEEDLASINASEASLAASAAGMLAEIQSLQQAQAQGQPLDLTRAAQVAADLHQAAQSLSGAATTEAGQAAAATGTGGTTTPTDPTGGGTTTDPTGGGTTTDPTGGGTTTDPTGGGTVTPPDTGGGTTTDAPNQPVYTYTGQGTPADPAWTPAPFLTSDGRQLYTFASDSPGSAANGNGLGGVWSVYDVTQGVQPAPTDAPTNEPSAPGTTS